METVSTAEYFDGTTTWQPMSNLPGVEVNSVNMSNLPGFEVNSVNMSNLPGFEVNSVNSVPLHNGNYTINGFQPFLASRTPEFELLVLEVIKRLSESPEYRPVVENVKSEFRSKRTERRMLRPVME